MERPTITIGGKVYEMPKPKAGIWRRLMLLDKENANLFSPDFVEKRCAFIATAYGDVFSAEMLLEELSLDEVTKNYKAATSFILNSIVPKLEEAEKNAGKDGKPTQ